MRAPFPILALHAALLLLAACTGVDGHARVTRTAPPELTAQNALNAAAYYNSPEFKLQHEDPRVPADYAEFKRVSIYPLTYKVWKNPALMKAAGPRRVLIDLQMQRGFLYVNDQVAMDFPVCSGKEDGTPRGSYTVLEKQVHHVSNLYDVSMPYFMRLTYDGIGMHVGYVGRAPLSHGCIRIPRAACIPLYNSIPTGTPVDVR